MTDSQWEYFSIEELTCQCGCGRMEMDSKFMELLVRLREHLGFPFPVTSGFRCPEHNARVSKSPMVMKYGPHVAGKAVDIHVYSTRAFLLQKHAMQFGFTGIGANLRGDISEYFVHLDTLENGELLTTRPNSWTY